MSKLLLFAILALWAGVDAGVTVNGVQCGSKRCKKDEFCPDLQKTCEKCDQICDDSTHNYDPTMCMEKCQDYIHDLRYGNSNLRETVQKLSNMVTVTFVMVCLLFVAIALYLAIQLYRWKKKKNITLSTIKEKFFKNKEKSGHQQQDKPSELRIDIPVPQQQSAQSDSPATMTTSISRRPAEDSTLDYAAYDNPAMATTPTKHEGRL